MFGFIVSLLGIGDWLSCGLQLVMPSSRNKFQVSSESVDIDRIESQSEQAGSPDGPGVVKRQRQKRVVTKRTRKVSRETSASNTREWSSDAIAADIPGTMAGIKEGTTVPSSGGTPVQAAAPARLGRRRVSRTSNDDATITSQVWEGASGPRNAPRNGVNQLAASGSISAVVLSSTPRTGREIDDGGLTGSAASRSQSHPTPSPGMERLGSTAFESVPHTREEVNALVAGKSFSGTSVRPVASESEGSLETHSPGRRWFCSVLGIDQATLQKAVRKAKKSPRSAARLLFDASVVGADETTPSRVLVQHYRSGHPAFCAGTFAELRAEITELRGLLLDQTKLIGGDVETAKMYIRTELAACISRSHRQAASRASEDALAAATPKGAQLTRASAANEALSDRVATLKSENQHMLNERDAMREELDTLRAQKNQRDIKYDEMVDLLRVRDDQIADLHAQLEEQVKNAANAEGRVSERAASLAEVRERMALAEKRNGDLNQEVARMVGEREALMKELSSEHGNALSDLVKRHELSVVELRQERETAEADWRQKYETLEMNHSELETQLAVEKSQVKELSGQLTGAQSKLESADHQLRSVEQTCNVQREASQLRLEDEQTARVRESETLRSELEGLKAIVVNLRNDNAEKDVIIRGLEVDVSAKKEQIDTQARLADEVREKHVTELTALREEQREMQEDARSLYERTLEEQRQRHDATLEELTSAHEAKVHEMGVHEAALETKLGQSNEALGRCQEAVRELEISLGTSKGEYEAQRVQHGEQVAEMREREVQGLEALRTSHSSLIVELNERHEATLRDVRSQHMNEMVKAGAEQRERIAVLTVEFRSSFEKAESDHKKELESELARAEQTLSAEQAERARERTHWEERFETVRLERTEALESLESSRKVRDSLEAQIVSNDKIFRSKIGDLESSRAAARLSADDLRHKLDRVEEAQRDFVNGNKQVQQRLMGIVDTQRARLNDFEVEVATLTRNVSELHQASEQKQAEHDQQKRELSAMKDNILASSQEEIGSLKGTVECKNQELEALRVELGGVRDEVSQLQTDCSRLTEEYARESTELKQLLLQEKTVADERTRAAAEMSHRKERELTDARENGSRTEATLLARIEDLVRVHREEVQRGEELYREARVAHENALSHVTLELEATKRHMHETSEASASVAAANAERSRLQEEALVAGHAVALADQDKELRQHYETEVSNMRETGSRLLEHMEARTAAVDAMRAATDTQLQNVHELVMSVQGTLGAVQTVVSETQGTQQDREDRLQALTGQFAEHSSKMLVDIEARTAAISGAAAEHASAVQATEAQLYGLNELCTGIQTTVQTLNLEAVKEEVAAVGGNVQQLQQQVAVSREEGVALRGVVDTIDAGRLPTETQLQNVHELVMSVQGTLGAVQTVVSETQGTQQDREDRLQALTGQFAEHSSKMLVDIEARTAAISGAAAEHASAVQATEAQLYGLNELCTGIHTAVQGLNQLGGDDAARSTRIEEACGTIGGGIEGILAKLNGIEMQDTAQAEQLAAVRGVCESAIQSLSGAASQLNDGANEVCDEGVKITTEQVHDLCVVIEGNVRELQLAIQNENVAVQGIQQGQAEVADQFSFLRPEMAGIKEAVDDLTQAHGRAREGTVSMEGMAPRIQALSHLHEEIEQCVNGVILKSPDADLENVRLNLNAARIACTEMLESLQSRTALPNFEVESAPAQTTAGA